MLKKSLLTFLILITTLQTFSHQDNQAEINKQEAILLASIKNFNPEELSIVKEYIKTLRKIVIYMDSYLNNEPLRAKNPEPASVFNTRISTSSMKIAKLKDLYGFIQNIYIQICALSSLVLNKHLEYNGEIIPFDEEGKSLHYMAELIEKMLDEIRKLQAN